jgi:UDP-N-acetyl-2-amino-2-deoxyglucuronate dehydrogenase
MSAKKFGVIGMAGYIAPRHLRGIKDTGNEVVVGLDKHDCVGIVDSYFPNASFFTEVERFDRFIEKKRLEEGESIDYFSICSPNYLHDFHIRMALRHGGNAICEKPLVLNPWNIDALEDIEKSSGGKVYNILQLRLHDKIKELRDRIKNGDPDKIYDIDLTYITSRGLWYYTSWKGELSKSGGIATNIGIHFFDMLMWIFGAVKQNTVHVHTHDRAAGYLELEKARVRWFLSINDETLPEEVKASGQRTYRSITVEGEEIEFSAGFTDLHTLSYDDILSGGGFGLSDARDSIQVAHDIRNMEPVGLKGEYHPFARKQLARHPFDL